MRLRTPFKQGLEIGARAFRLAPRGFRRFAHAKITVDQARALMMPGRDPCRRQRVGISLALVAQGIEPGRADDRRRKSCKAVQTGTSVRDEQKCPLGLRAAFCLFHIAE